MLLKLIRNTPQGKALLGQLYVDGAYFCDTLEHTNYAIPDGCYRLRMTYSPHFKKCYRFWIMCLGTIAVV